MTRAESIVAELAAAFINGRLDVMTALLADDCDDRNPVAEQPPGRDGILFKAAAFHARFAGFGSTLADVHEDPDGHVIAGWTTRFSDGTLTAWRGRFEVGGGLIASFEVGRVG